MPVERGSYELNQVKRPWPTFTDLQTWVNTSGEHSITISDEDVSAYQWCVDAAISAISARTQLDVYERETTASIDDMGCEYYATKDPLILNSVPSSVWLATVMQAARLVARRNTPDGMTGSPEFENVQRTSSIDPDIMALLGDHIVYGLA